MAAKIDADIVRSFLPGEPLFLPNPPPTREPYLAYRWLRGRRTPKVTAESASVGDEEEARVYKLSREDVSVLSDALQIHRIQWAQDVEAELAGVIHAGGEAAQWDHDAVSIHRRHIIGVRKREGDLILDYDLDVPQSPDTACRRSMGTIVRDGKMYLARRHDEAGFGSVTLPLPPPRAVPRAAGQGLRERLVAKGRKVSACRLVFDRPESESVIHLAAYIELPPSNTRPDDAWLQARTHEQARARLILRCIGQFLIAQVGDECNVDPDDVSHLLLAYCAHDWSPCTCYTAHTDTRSQLLGLNGPTDAINLLVDHVGDGLPAIKEWRAYMFDLLYQVFPGMSEVEHAAIMTRLGLGPDSWELDVPNFWLGEGGGYVEGWEASTIDPALVAFRDRCRENPSVPGLYGIRFLDPLVVRGYWLLRTVGAVLWKQLTCYVQEVRKQVLLARELLRGAPSVSSSSLSDTSPGAGSIVVSGSLPRVGSGVILDASSDATDASSETTPVVECSGSGTTTTRGGRGRGRGQGRGSRKGRVVARVRARPQRTSADTNTQEIMVAGDNRTLRRSARRK
ncbi:hypothetical protein B0I35DRAFT_485565 [Stachybotrys elegans]|uniref:Uncharacterized protein n=1 Tax=Stachybotrys elegans TaxID=80388 RepID=A0A8K0WJG2_9HYPO|nr:hypothetical protein B0I35DRAFT_485565 [Stachybotrys elegans]